MDNLLKLGDIIDLVSSVRQITTLLDAAADPEKLRVSLHALLEDRKTRVKLLVALKRAERAADQLSNSPLSFMGGLVAEDEPEMPEPSPVPRRAQRIANDPKERKRVMGDEIEVFISIHERTAP